MMTMLSMKLPVSLLSILLLVPHGAASTTSGIRGRSRELSQELFLSYEPVTTVTDQAAIDLDQAALERQLALGTDGGRQAALRIYSQGAFSGSYAEIALNSPLQVDVSQGVTVVGQTADGVEVRLQTSSTHKAGDSIVLLTYQASPVQADWTACHVGGNPDPNTMGCLAPLGAVEIGELGQMDYTYDPLASNYNFRTLQGFSTQAEETMYNCHHCPLETYLKFFKYYGVFDYANQWVLAAFNGGPTNFAQGNADFRDYGMEGTIEAIKKGTAYMNVWMQVIREMESAVADCENDCQTAACNDDQVHAWDAAVAYYTGSVPKTTGNGGHLLYTLAQKRCQNYGTCVASGANEGMAHVNEGVFFNFRQGKQNLLLGNCAEARVNVERITQLMTIPLIQGTIRYAYTRDIQFDTREKAEAEGAVFAAAVLPLVHACSAEDAAIIYNNMRVGSGDVGVGGVSFDVVKSAFERNYACLGVTCADVGGLVDSVTDGYLRGAEPCIDNIEDEIVLVEDFELDDDCMGNSTSLGNMTMCNMTLTDDDDNSTLTEDIGISASRSILP